MQNEKGHCGKTPQQNVEEALDWNLASKEFHKDNETLLSDLREKLLHLIDLQERSAKRYKACFGKQNPGGEQIYLYFAMQLKQILQTIGI